MKGTSGELDQASAASVTIDMKRFVGKITVREVALEWTNPQNAVHEFTLRSIYIANAGDRAEGATATYNVGGVYSPDAMDAMLYSPVNSVIADGAKYGTPQMMYAYASGTAELVLECTLGGETMYYHVPYEPDANTHRSFKLTVRQAGAGEPLGELPEEAIEVSVTTLNILGFEESEQDTDFGEVPVPVAPEGVSIKGIDGCFYSAAEWAASGRSNDEAVGVAVSYDGHAFLIHPTAEQELAWSSNTSVTVDGVYTNDVDSYMSDDFNGLANTAAILAAVDAGIIEDAPAAQYAAGVTFADGSKGYLPGYGELQLTYFFSNHINSCLDVIGGTQFRIDYVYYDLYWSSTQYSSEAACVPTSYNSMLVDWGSKDDSYLVRVFGEMSTSVTGSDSSSPSETVLVGVSILGTDLKYYTYDQWNSSGMENTDAVGVAVYDGEHGFVIHPTAEQELAWSSNTSVTVDGVFTTEDEGIANKDFTGEANTVAILAAVANGTIADAPAAQYAAGITFADGRKGRLPTKGELQLARAFYLNLSGMYECFDAIDGINFNIFCWSSTQLSNNEAWIGNGDYKLPNYLNKNDNRYVRVVSDL